MAIIDPTELNDYKTILHNHGYSKEDFELSQRENPIQGGAIQQITGEIIIKNKQSEIEKTYKAGYGSQWVIDFEEDLKNNVFK